MKRTHEQSGPAAATPRERRALCARPSGPPSGRPRVTVALRWTGGAADIQVQAGWHCRLSGATAARALIAIGLALAGLAWASGGGEPFRDVLYGLAGFLAGARPRLRP